MTVSRHGRLAEVLDLMENKDISAVPVVDDDGKVTHLYSRSDITFLATATDAESVIANLDLTIGRPSFAASPMLPLRRPSRTCGLSKQALTLAGGRACARSRVPSCSLT